VPVVLHQVVLNTIGAGRKSYASMRALSLKEEQVPNPGPVI